MGGIAMKKIMFNDRYGLTRMVIKGRKTQTRRLIKCRKTFKGEWVAGFNIHIRPSDKKVVGLPCMYDADEGEFEGGEILPKYKIGEVVAVAQSMCDVYAEWDMIHSGKDTKSLMKKFGGSPCFNNKMFVRASEMPHQIRITDVRVERLQDISDEDCLKEGVRKVVNENGIYIQYYVGQGNNACSFENPREAFAHLINKVCRKDVWQENPYVFVYDFELLK